MNAPAPVAPIDALDRLSPVSSRQKTNADEFEHLLDAAQPILFKNLVSHWPACAAGIDSPAALDAYLIARDSGAPVPVMEAPPASRGRFGYLADVREYSFTKRSRPLRETLERIAAARTQAVAATIAIQMLPLDTQMPKFLRDNQLALVPPDSRPKLWIGGPVKTQIHNDCDHNLACVIAGHRRFVLFPPEQVDNLYIGPLDNPPPLSLVDPEAPDFDRFPRFRDALDHALVAHLGPGDALLMPRYWWHHVTSRDPYNAMVNFWWGVPDTGFGSPNDAFLAALLALKSLPPGERTYWRVMFDHHVFGDDGAAHIPPPARGMLGRMTPQLRASLRQRLKAAILKS